jgi:hypothetical protein
LLRAELRHDLGSPGNVARVEDANSVTPFSAMAASRSAASPWPADEMTPAASIASVGAAKGDLGPDRRSDGRRSVVHRGADQDRGGERHCRRNRWPLRGGGADSKLRGCDVVALKVEDVAPNGYTLERATVRQRKTRQPVKFELTEQTRQAVEDYLRASGISPASFYRAAGMAAIA